MSILTDDELNEFINNYIDSPVKLDHDGVFIDITLDRVIKVEGKSHLFEVIKAGEDSLNMNDVDLREGSYSAPPQSFIMGLTQQFFRMPMDVVGTLYLRSTEARVGIQHSVALPLKRGWQGQLVLELTNATEHHCLEISEGMKIGQIKLERVKWGSPYEGKFNNQDSITFNGNGVNGTSGSKEQIN